eukprot:209926-Amphidinium_carterae.1
MMPGESVTRHANAALMPHCGNFVTLKRCVAHSNTLCCGTSTESCRVPPLAAFHRDRLALAAAEENASKKKNDEEASTQRGKTKAAVKAGAMQGKASPPSGWGEPSSSVRSPVVKSTIGHG